MNEKQLVSLSFLWWQAFFEGTKENILHIFRALVSFDEIYFIFLKICLNGKCVVEHENSVDYEGPGFLRRSGLADVKSVDDVIQDTPAEPSNAR